MEFFLIIINRAHLISVVWKVANDCAKHDILTLCKYAVLVIYFKIRVDVYSKKFYFETSSVKFWGKLLLT